MQCCTEGKYEEVWNQVLDERDLLHFMEYMRYFHDSCIKELKYISGAYVQDDLSMYPVNDRRVLRVIVQCQFEDPSMIEMEFKGLRKLRLFPLDEDYTCEILAASMMIKDNNFYWFDSEELKEKEQEDYEGTFICSSEFRWRVIDGCMGNGEFYGSVRPESE